MALTSHQHEPDPQQYPRLSPDEQRIANAVVAALRPELKTIRETQEQHTKTLEQHSKTLEQHSKTLKQHTETLEQHTKILNNLQQEMRGVNRILAGEGLILDDPDI